MFLHSRSLLFALSAALLVSMSACGDGAEDDNHHDDHHHNHHHHEHGGWMEVHTRGVATAMIAVWDEEEGWQDGDGNPVDELPTPVDDEVDGLVPFAQMGQRASLTLRFFNSDGSEIEMSTVLRDEETGVRDCSEYSVQYFPADGEEETNIIHWGGLIRHPDDPTGPAQFIEIDEEPRAIFHCDHVHIYPRDAGEVEVEFALWHGDHSDRVTDPIRLRVDGGE